MRWLDGIIDSMDMSLSKLGVGEGLGYLVCCSPWGCKESDMTEWQNNNYKVTRPPVTWSTYSLFIWLIFWWPASDLNRDTPMRYDIDYLSEDKSKGQNFSLAGVTFFFFFYYKGQRNLCSGRYMIDQSVHKMLYSISLQPMKMDEIKMTS